MYEVRLSRQAESYLARLPRPVQQRVVNRLLQIAENPFGLYTKPLTGLPGYRAARVGDWRIVFTVDATGEAVNVSDIGPRGEIYRNL